MELVEFDEEFFESLEGKEKVLIKKEGFNYTILINGEKAGIVGFFPSIKNNNEGFVQIILSPKFRGGYLNVAEDFLAEKHNLIRLYATIKTENIVSIKAHMKARFKLVSENKMKILREIGVLGDNEIRMIKEY